MTHASTLGTNTCDKVWNKNSHANPYIGFSRSQKQTQIKVALFNKYSHTFLYDFPKTKTRTKPEGDSRKKTKTHTKNLLLGRTEKTIPHTKHWQCAKSRKKTQKPTSKNVWISSIWDAIQQKIQSKRWTQTKHLADSSPLVSSCTYHRPHAICWPSSLYRRPHRTKTNEPNKADTWQVQWQKVSVLVLIWYADFVISNETQAQQTRTLFLFRTSYTRCKNFYVVPSSHARRPAIAVPNQIFWCDLCSMARNPPGQATRGREEATKEKTEATNRWTTPIYYHFNNASTTCKAMIVNDCFSVNP